MAAPYWRHGDDPYTLQHEACGKMGKYIHFTPNFLANDYVTDIYGSRGKFPKLFTFPVCPYCETKDGILKADDKINQF